MKKILFIIWSYSLGGGSEALLTTIVNHLNPMKYQIGIIEFYHDTVKKEPVKSCIKIYDSITFKGDEEYQKKLYYVHQQSDKMIRKYIPLDYDLYISFNYQIPSFLLPGGRKNIVWIHSDVYDLSGKDRKYYWNLQAAAFRKVQKIVSISTTTTQSLVDLFPEYSHKIVEIFNGIDVYRVRKLACEKTEVRLNKKAVVFIGKMDNRKNPLRMLEIFRGVYRKNELTHLYFLGNGKLEAQVREKVREFGLQGRVHFLGYMENPFPIIKQADVCCMTSRSEGFPMSLLESVALHVPFVSTEVGGAWILSNEGRCGKVYRTNEEAVDYIVEFLESSEESVVRNCEDSIQRFALDTYISKIEKLFDEVLETEMITDERTIWDDGQSIGVLEDRSYYYHFPNGLIENGRKIILYGAGDIGTNYYNYIKETGLYQVIAWVDAAAEKYVNSGKDVGGIETIFQVEYDFLLIAVLEEDVSQSIRTDLCERGIPDSKIMWVKPIF